jgi:hypothetical protein
VYVSAHDEREKLAVWVVGSLTAEEWERHFADLRELAGWSKRGSKRAAVVLVLTNAFDRGDAKSRATLAELTEADGYDPFIAVVTKNPFARSVLTVLMWLQSKPSYEIKFHGAADDALDWLERCRREPVDKLRGMLDRAMAEAGLV